MSHVRSQHPNARLTPRHRRNMVDALLVDGWPVAAVAERFQVDPKTVRKWRDRFVAEGPDGLWDRSSRPRQGACGALRERPPRRRESTHFRTSPTRTAAGPAAFMLKECGCTPRIDQHQAARPQRLSGEPQSQQQPTRPRCWPYDGIAAPPRKPARPPSVGFPS